MLHATIVDTTTERPIGTLEFDTDTAMIHLNVDQMQPPVRSLPAGANTRTRKPD